MLKTTASLLGGLLYAGAALAQQPFTELTPPIAPPQNAAVDTEMQQYITPHMRIDSAPVPANMPTLNYPTLNGGVAHILPDAIRLSRILGASNSTDNGPLLYHKGPTVEHPVIYEIYWSPAKLQTGTSTGYSANFAAVNVAVGSSYNGHAIGNITTQYGQVISGTASYPKNDGLLAAVIVDQDPYPASGCINPTTPGNCLNDAQVQAEIVKVVQAQKWQVGLNSIFVLYTSGGEGSCMSANSQLCSEPGGYCAYHGAVVPQNNDLNGVILYAVIPYPPRGGGCLAPGKSPNNDVDADSAANSFSHEVTEVITNPLGDAWYSAQGKEIGDLCAGLYGPNTYANGLANQVWNGVPFELQTEFDNHSQQCVQVGPLYIVLTSA